MLILDESLGEFDRELLVALDCYLANRNLAGASYLIAPDGAEKRAPCALFYGAKPAFQGLDTRVEWAMADGPVDISSKLAGGIRFFAMLLGEGWIDQSRLLQSTLGPRDSLGKLNLSYVKHWSNSLQATADTAFIAPIETGFAMAYMDVRPPAEIQAWSQSASAVALRLAVAEAETEAGISAMLAAFLP